MKGLDALTWEETGHARRQMSERLNPMRTFIGPFTELAATFYANQFDTERRNALQRVSSEAPVLSTERLIAIVALLDEPEETN